MLRNPQHNQLHVVGGEEDNHNVQRCCVCVMGGSMGGIARGSSTDDSSP